jgi:DNA-binding response OmpR family regulator
VVVFTSSDQPKDITRAFELGANSYVVKPTGFDKLQETVRYLEAYWTRVNRCPDCTVSATEPGSGMRVLVRNPETGEYFQNGNLWTDDPKRAMNFERSERAAQWALAEKLQRFEIVVDVAEGKTATARSNART